MNANNDLIGSVENILQYVDLILELLQKPFVIEDVHSLTDDNRRYLELIAKHTNELKFETQALVSTLDKLNDTERMQILHTTRHNLRNHINSIIGFSEILDEDPSEASQLDSQKLQKIISNAKLILQNINQLQIHPQVNSEELSQLQEIHPEMTDRIEEVEAPDLQEFRKNFSILIVDDVEENCQLLEKHLLKTGFQNIQIAYNATEAKQKLAESKIDLVLLDIDMPVISGIALLEDLKQDIANLQLMVIMVTGSDTVENAIQCIKLGAEDFLTKPINTEMLRVRIGACLRKKWFLIKQKEYAEYLEFERKRYEDLLNAIFPPTIVTELSITGRVVARSYNNVSMLFVDVVGFTQYCDTHDLDDTMQGIQDFSAICEAAASKYNLQKIKTIGDGFLAIAGMLTEHENPVQDCIRTAIEILENTKQAQNHWMVRAGIDFGTIIGGVVGHRQYLFDIWGDSVNTAARAQAAANPDRICVTARAWRTVSDVCEGDSLGVVSLKGKGVPMELFEFVKMR